MDFFPHYKGGGMENFPSIKLNRADPLRASLRSVGWHGKLH
jgi:hypothetical protein